MAAPVLPIAKHVHEELAQRATPNADKLSVARRLISAAKEHTIFVTKAKVQALVQQEKEEVSCITRYLSLMPPYPASTAAKPYPVGYTVPNFHKFDGRKGNTREHVFRFIKVMGPFSQRRTTILKSLIHRAYTWYLNLKSGLIQNCEHLVTVFNTKFSYGEVTFTLIEFGSTQQFPGEDVDLYVKKFHERALDCCDAVNEEKWLTSVHMLRRMNTVFT